MKSLQYNQNIFINCPFDPQYEPILQAIAFVVISANFSPRLAKESSDSGATRLTKIVDLIEDCRYSIHDLSRAQAKRKGEHYRLNMPFELGMDYGCKKFNADIWGDKRILILEEKPFRHQISISDLAGSDIMSHANDYLKAMRCVRDWLNVEVKTKLPGVSAIEGKYIAFQKWYYERELSKGSSEDDIKQYPTPELLSAMKEWRDTEA